MKEQILQALRDKLCEVEEVREDIEQNEYTIPTLWYKNEGMHRTYLIRLNILYCFSRDEALGKVIREFQEEKGNENYAFHYELISENKQPLEERHLRMYCKEKRKMFSMNVHGTINDSLGDITTKLDNKKSIENQDTEVLQAILDYISN